MKPDTYDKHFYVRVFISLTVLVVGLGWSELLPKDSGLQKILGLLFPDLRNGYQYISHMVPTTSADFLAPLRKTIPSWLWLSLFFVSSVFFVRNRRPFLSSLMMFLICFLIASSAGGRRIGFDAFGYILLGYLGVTGLLKVRKIWSSQALELNEHYRWLGAVSGLCLVYTSSAIAKLVHSGLGWISSSKLALFLQFQHHYTELGYVPLDLSPYFPEFLHRPHWVSSLFSALTVIIELGALGFVFSKRYLPLLLLLLALFQTGIGVTTGIWLPHIFLPIYVFSLLSFFILKDIRAKVPIQDLLIIFGFSLCLLLLTWTLPSEPRSDRKLFYPFATFSMFSVQTNYLSSFEFFDPSGKNVDIREIAPSSMTNTMMVNFPLDGNLAKARQVLCHIFLSPDSSYFDEKWPFQTKEFRFSFDEKGELVQEVIPFVLTKEDCQKPQHLLPLKNGDFLQKSQKSPLGCAGNSSMSTFLCLEGYGRSLARASNYDISKVKKTLADFSLPAFYYRALYLGVGLGFSKMELSDLKESVSENSDYFYEIYDGWAFGRVSPKKSVKAVFRECGTLDESKTKDVCLFGLGRKTFFLKTLYNRRIPMLEDSIVKLGFGFASRFVGGLHTAEDEKTREGVALAELFLKYLDGSDSHFTDCLSKVPSHPIFCYSDRHE